MTRNLDKGTANNRLAWPQFYQRSKYNSNMDKKTAEEYRRKNSQYGSSGQSAGLERLPPDEARAIQKANQIVM